MTTQARELAKLVSNAGDVNLGDDISLASDGAILNFGADSDVVITHVADTGLLLNSSRQLQFGDSGTYISQSADGVLQLTSDTEVEINATTVDINANVDISGNLVLGGNITIGDADSDDISFGGELTSHIIPNADNTYDLGSSTKEWRNAYFDGTVTSDAFAGPLTGDVTGNVSGTAATVTGAAQSSITSLGTLTTLTVDDITINGSTISDAGAMTIDVGGNLTLDADGDHTVFAYGGSGEVGRFSNESQNLVLYSLVSDKDMKFNGNDGGSTITALTLDMSDAGTATFNNTIKVSVDSDVVAEIGRAHVGGGLSGLSDYAVFSHLHAADSGGYALAQNASGATFLNADDGQDITFLAHGSSIATLASDATLTLTGGLVIPSTITHAGDTDTKLDFNQANTMRLITGDTTAWIANASSMVINEDSADFDFRVESNDSANMLSVDGGDNTVTIAANNTASVTNSATALAARTLIINGNEGEGSDNLSIFAMADGTGNYGMEVSNSAHTAQYDLLINPIMGGNVGIGTTSATSQLHLENSASNSVVQVGYKNDAQEWRMGVHGGVSDSFLLYDNTGGSTRLKVTTAGAISSTTGGMVLQTKEVYANTATTISSGGTADVVNTTITVLEQSKIAVWYHSGQIQNNGNSQNPNGVIQWENSGGTTTNISDYNNNHTGWDASTHVERMFIASQGISAALSAGTYTVRFLAGAYGGSVIFNYQGGGGHMIIQEISAG